MARMLVVFCALTLAGCGAAKVDPRAYAHAEYQSADDEYRACINDNLKNVEKCEGRRVQMETNRRTYDNVIAGIKQPTNPAPTQGAGIAQSAKTVNATQAASSPLSAGIPPTPQATSSLEPPTTSSLPELIPPPPGDRPIPF
jgi:hypothetical protein